MNRNRSLCLFVMVCAGGFGAAQAVADGRPGAIIPPTAIGPRPNVTVTIPRTTVDIRPNVNVNVNRGGAPTVNVNARPPTVTVTKPPPVPAVVVNSVSMTAPDGTVLTTAEMRNYNNKLNETQIARVISIEETKYASGTYTLVDDKAPPSRQQDCGGNAVEQLYGIPNVGMDADKFEKGIIKGTNAQVITDADSGSIDWSKVSDKDVIVFYWPSGVPGHITTVKDAASGTIITKDGTERIRQGQLNVGDDLHKAYENGRIVVYRVDTSIKPVIAPPAPPAPAKKK